MESRRIVAKLEVIQRASAWGLQMESAARDVCMAMGSDEPREPPAVVWALQGPRDYFASDFLGAPSQDVA